MKLGYRSGAIGTFQKCFPRPKLSTGTGGKRCCLDNQQGILKHTIPNKSRQSSTAKLVTDMSVRPPGTYFLVLGEHTSASIIRSTACQHNSSHRHRRKGVEPTVIQGHSPDEHCPGVDSSDGEGHGKRKENTRDDVESQGIARRRRIALNPGRRVHRIHDAAVHRHRGVCTAVK